MNSELRNELIAQGRDGLSVLEILENKYLPIKKREWLLFDEETAIWRKAHDIAARNKSYEISCMSVYFSEMLIKEAIKLLKEQV
jgi:hypothetical protein